MTDTTIDTTMTDVFFDTLAERVSEQDTGDFLATQLRGDYLWAAWFEDIVYPKAKRLDSNYNREPWKFAKTKSEPSFFMYPDSDTTYNCHGKQIDSRTFGLIVTLQSLEVAGFNFLKINREFARLCDELYSNLCAAFFTLVQDMADSKNSTLTQEQKDEVNSILYAVTSCLD